MIKMQKNFIAVNVKGYPQQPYDQFSARFLLDRFHQESAELEEAFGSGDVEAIKKEIADCSNILDYLFEKMLMTQKNE